MDSYSSISFCFFSEDHCSGLSAQLECKRPVYNVTVRKILNKRTLWADEGSINAAQTPKQHSDDQ